MINNNIIDISHFQEDDATDLERSVYAKYLSRQEGVLSSIEAMLNNANAPAYKDASSDMKEYMSYIVNTYLMKTTGILNADKVDTKDATYVDWTKNEVINLSTYLNYAISKGWIDVSRLNLDTKYLNSQEAYTTLVGGHR